MDRIVRIAVVGRKGQREVMAFDIERFVSYNVDTRRLVLVNGEYIVRQDSENAVIKAYRSWFNSDGHGSEDKEA